MSRDLMFQEQVRDLVRAAYGELGGGAGRAVAERFYSTAELARVPEQAVAWSLGVGNPVRHAQLTAGQVVLDIGCGAGIDTVLAAREVGPTGRVIGLDLLPEMCERARESAELAGVADWCEFLPGEMEAIPCAEASVDVVISNGVINLSPRKSRTLAEIARVLKPGGRVCVADLTVEEDLPPAVLASDAAWAGCIAGAVSQAVLARKLARAGFDDVSFDEPTPFSVDDVALYPLFPPAVVELMRRLIPEGAQKRVAVGLVVRAHKRTGAADSDLPSWGAATTTDLDDVPVADVKAPGVTVRNLKRVEDIELKVLDVEPDAATPYHTHPHAHEGVVVSGEGRLRLADRSEPLRPGQVFSVPPTEPHAIESAAGEPFRIVCMDCFVE